MSNQKLPTEQTAIVYDHYGDASAVLHPRSVPVRAPGEAEVLVRIRAAGVNPADAKIRAGFWKSYPISFPAVGGWDIAGEVVASGYAARRFQPGQAVFAYVRRPSVSIDGAYAQFITIPESYLVPMPTSLDFIQAAAVPLAALTAYQGLTSHGALQAGESVLILGASGGVGLFAVQLARVFGAGRIVAVASTKNHALLKEHGATDVIDYKSDIAKELRQVLPEGVALVYDCFGGEGLKLADQYLQATGGRIVSIAGSATFSNPALTVKGYIVEPNAPHLEHISRLLDEGRLKVVVHTVYKLEEVAKAHEQVMGFHTTGKIVLSVEHA